MNISSFYCSFSFDFFVFANICVNFVGTTWTPTTINIDMTYLTVTNNKFVASNSDPARITYSDDGLTWTTTNTNYGLRFIRSGVFPGKGPQMILL
jgi:hypothetical protein